MNRCNELELCLVSHGLLARRGYSCCSVCPRAEQLSAGPVGAEPSGPETASSGGSSGA